MSSHVFRKTTANAMDELGPPVRLIADQSGTRVSMTQTSTGSAHGGAGGGRSSTRLPGGAAARALG